MVNKGQSSEFQREKIKTKKKTNATQETRVKLALDLSTQY